jgi:hypothetical protein
MPLYKKALKFMPQDLEHMTFDECYELLLIFRYLQFRGDNTLDSEIISTRMEQLKNRMRELNENSANYQNTI